MKKLWLMMIIIIMALAGCGYKYPIVKKVTYTVWESNYKTQRAKVLPGVEVKVIYDDGTIEKYTSDDHGIATFNLTIKDGYYAIIRFNCENHWENTDTIVYYEKDQIERTIYLRLYDKIWLRNTYGEPDEIIVLSDGREIWKYFSINKSFTLQNDRICSES